jgi:alpha-galactosidase
MGWNSWDCYGTSVTEAEVLANAAFMAEHLKPFGWEYIVVDIQWSEPDAQAGGYRPFAPLVMDAYGRLLPAPNRFPSASGGAGFRPLADAVHTMGLKLGIHIMRGIPRQAVAQNTPVLNTPYFARDIADIDSICAWNTDMFGLNMNHPGAQAYLDSLLALYAAWEVDFIKADDMLHPYRAAEIEGYHRAVEACGRDIVLSLSPGVDLSVDHADHLKQNSDMWRISADFWDRWQDLYDQFALCAQWAEHVGAGRWPDADMLPLGHIGIRAERGIDRDSLLTLDEQRTLITLWCIFRSPLMMGGDLPTTRPETIALLTNPEVLAVLQTSSNGREFRREGDHIIWTADANDERGSSYVALFNAGEEAADLSVEFLEIGITGAAILHDVWLHGDYPQEYVAMGIRLEPHMSALFRVTPVEL